MGIMECSRKGCENIMCADYSEETGYICYECKSELEESNPTSVQDVKYFMKTNKKKYQINEKFSLAKMFGEEE